MGGTCQKVETLGTIRLRRARPLLIAAGFEQPASALWRTLGGCSMCYNNNHR
jgi:hypothetical protein